ncbi:MAG TPA: N-acetylmuramoyl-L-alanine amidase [Thermoanaerobaculia bacterium]|jgi:N-acetylmuramoyl-L-alanine amidase|nr:N-acetylmuramoyl-L-alanine amidase [Thermoanaerobaculia bacterium]
MAQDIDRLKRQLLRDLVQENVDLKEGRLPRGLRKRRLPMALRVLALSLLPLGLLGSRLLPSLTALAPSSVPAQAQAVVPAPSLPLPPADLPEPEGTIRTAPTPVAAAVFPLAVRKIAIDPGHGGDSLGTKAPLGLVEKELTLDIARRVRGLLEPDYQVLMTRQDDTSLSLEDRGLSANRAGADIFVSIHLNWIEDRKTRGIETYYLGPTDDPFLTRLAADENRESGYSLADMRRLLDRIYAGVRQEKSKRLAEVVQASLFGSLGKVSPGLQNRGVKAAPFIVLLTTEMPAILAEVSCLSNEDEAELLTQPQYRQTIAEALAAGVRSYADTVEGQPGKKGI